MDSLRKLLGSEIFLATMPPSIMLYCYVKRERDFDESFREMRENALRSRAQIVETLQGSDS